MLLTRDSILGCVIFMLFVCSVAWLFLLGCQLQLVATPTGTITCQQSHFSHNNTEKYSQAHDACLAAVGRQVPRCQHWDAGSAEEVELSTANCLQRCLMADKWCYSDLAEPAGSFPLPKYTDNNSTSSYFKFTYASNVS